MQLSIRYATLLGAISGMLRASLASQAADSSVRVSDIHVFPNGTAVENLNVRASGEILACIVTSPELYQIEPVENAPAALVHTFPGYESLLGIVEVGVDQFYVAAGNLNAYTDESIVGSYSVFHVNMSTFASEGETVISPAQIDKIADFPEAQLLNGLGLLSKEKGLVYIADSYAGNIILLDVNSGEYSIAINNSLTVQGPPLESYPAANGIHVFHSSLNDKSYAYFSNAAQTLLARVQIHANGSAIGEPEVIASDLVFDDFAIDDKGNVFAAVFGSNEVVRIDAITRNVTVVAGNPDSTEFEAATAVQFGRGRGGHGLYVSRNGGIGQPTQVGGAIRRIDLY